MNNVFLYSQEDLSIIFFISISAEESFFEGEQQEANSNLLMRLILSCLQRCFVYDKGAFVSKERFELLSQPVVDQVRVGFSRCLMFYAFSFKVLLRMHKCSSRMCEQDSDKFLK